MTEVTDEARAELDAIIAELAKVSSHSFHLGTHQRNAIMLALDRHHGRTPPDPMEYVAVRLLEAGGILPDQVDKRAFIAFVAQLHKEFPDG